MQWYPDFKGEENMKVILLTVFVILTASLKSLAQRNSLHNPMVRNMVILKAEKSGIKLISGKLHVRTSDLSLIGTKLNLWLNRCPEGYWVPGISCLHVELKHTNVILTDQFQTIPFVMRDFDDYYKLLRFSWYTDFRSSPFADFKTEDIKKSPRYLIQGSKIEIKFEIDTK